MDDKQRFLAKTVRKGECLVWTGAIDAKTGYGRFKIGGRAEMAHRAAYMLFVGPIPNGKLICHSCDNRPCVEPAHLWPGSYSDNMQDCADKDRIYRPTPNDVVRGEDHGFAKLTDFDASLIKALLMQGRRRVDLATEFGVHKAQITRIANGQAWSHVPAFNG